MAWRSAVVRGGPSGPDRAGRSRCPMWASSRTMSARAAAPLFAFLVVILGGPLRAQTAQDEGNEIGNTRTPDLMGEGEQLNTSELNWRKSVLRSCASSARRCEVPHCAATDVISISFRRITAGGREHLLLNPLNEIFFSSWVLRLSPHCCT